jgi:putative ABC transport system permease protein
MGVFLTIALRNLIQAKRRTLFLASALGMVTMLLILLLSLSQGITDNMTRSATTLSAGHVNVAGFFKTAPGDASPIVTERDRLKKIVKENTPGLDFVVDRHRGWGKVVSETGSIQTGLSGIILDEEPNFLDVLQLAEQQEYKEGGEERVLGDATQLREPKTAMLFASQAKRLDVEVGDVVTISTETLRGARNTTDVRVVAIAKDLGFLSNWTVFVHRQTVLELYQLKDDTTGAIMVYLKDIDQAEQTMAHLRGVLEKEGFVLMDHQPQPFFAKFETVSGEDWTGQKLDLTTWSDEVSFLDWVITGLNTLSFFLIGILVVIIAVGIMNTMYISVRERTQEIGTLRAVGMSRIKVLWMIMLEALLLGFGASLLGAAVGAGIALGVDAAQFPVPVDAMKLVLLSDTIQMSVEAGQLAQAVLTFTLLTGLAALLPSIRAARMQPVTAIQSV